MKRVLLILAAAIMTATTLSAQVVPGMKYKELKDIYNPKDYVKSSNDPHISGLYGLASAVVPGLGQIVCGEVGRGVAVIAGDAAFGIAATVCVYKFLDYVEKDANGNYVKDANGSYVISDEKAAMPWSIAIVAVSAANLAYGIWNICDAVTVAKVKNMYYQDLQGARPMEMELYPSVDFARSADGFQPVAGMTLAVRF